MTEKRTIIAGSRSIDSYDQVTRAIETAPFEIGTVISGGADGVDELGEKWAKENNHQIEQVLPEDYEEEANEQGIPSPLARNKEMAQRGSALIAVWDGESRGTQHMISCARKNDLEIHLVRADSRRLDEF